MAHSARQRADEYLAAGDTENARRQYAEASRLMLDYGKDLSGEMREKAIGSARRLMEISQAVKPARDTKRAPVQAPPQPAPAAINRQVFAPACDSKNSVAEDIKRTSGARTSLDADSAGKKALFVPVEKPNVRFEDIAGLEDVKRLVRLKVIEPLRHPDLYTRFNKDSNGGVLLYGPPGTGKTMIARAIATETQLDFYSVRCSDIVGTRFGDGERNLKALFDNARESGNAMIFFDEFEALASRRGSGSTIMNRIVPELLSQMDGFIKAEGRLIILASTNRPWDLDTAVLRPPRMTEKIYVGLPDFSARLYLIKHRLLELPSQGDLNYGEMAERTEGFNCADVAAFCGKVKEGPITRGLLTGDETQFITPEDVDGAFACVRSSVQKSDLEALSRWEASQAH